ncbi:MAG TPA: LptF/LptG family permease [Verrucomicrobiae bacterium]|nr:LptF/LptG family permease [Verrucomicrobiae bacterium]
MKTLHIYLTRQILASLVMTVMVFTFVLLLGNALKEILPWLVSGQVRLGVVAQAIGLLVPFVWVFALPMGMLTATLLIFGRFSADQEFTAVRASGISLLSLISPILLLSLVLCGLSALINMELGPRCRVAYTAIRFKLEREFSTTYLPEGRLIKDFPGYMFYVGKNRKGNLEDVLILELQNQTNVTRKIHAETGKMEIDKAKNRIDLTLYNARFVTLGSDSRSAGNFGEIPIYLDLNSAKSPSFQPKIDDMTFGQLWDELHDLERRISFPIALKNLTPEQRKAAKKQLQDRRREVITPIIFQIHRQVAFSFACFGFTLIGIPLGIRVQRRETNVGIWIALLLVAVYYSFIVLGQAFQTRPEYLPQLIVWLPNFLFESVGAFLLWRANRGI